MIDDGVLRHPANSKAWKDFNLEHMSFAMDGSNVRLGIAIDGFNLFGNMSNSYSMWPVFIVLYNLPLWKCMKDPFFIMSLLIPRPKASGNDIDVYLQPLINELKELWDVGVNTYDAAARQNFCLRAVVLWTINDFPTYGNLSSWSTKGKLACPSCNKDTSNKRLKHGNKTVYMRHRRNDMHMIDVDVNVEDQNEFIDNFVDDDSDADDTHFNDDKNEEDHILSNYENDTDEDYISSD
ncbi:hypothetical protein LWI28_001464 [Acer negundo]|uniref:Transposase n=1 Tax=Acer negundo TaxID=4023 RepID=A0AAD5IBI8_ACENE|nr:hypothetical protein LWI28_001464 [Acer negundo]